MNPYIDPYLDYLREKFVNPCTPVLIRDGVVFVWTSALSGSIVHKQYIQSRDCESYGNLPEVIECDRLYSLPEPMFLGFSQDTGIF